LGGGHFLTLRSLCCLHRGPGSLCAPAQVSIFYTAPTAVRALHAKGDEWVTKHSRASLQLLGSVGEPINPDAHRWYKEVVGGGRCASVSAVMLHAPYLGVGVWVWVCGCAWVRMDVSVDRWVCAWVYDAVHAVPRWLHACKSLRLWPHHMLLDEPFSLCSCRIRHF